MNFNVRSTYLFKKPHVFCIFLPALGLLHDRFGTFPFLVSQFYCSYETTNTLFWNANYFIA